MELVTPLLYAGLDLCSKLQANIQERAVQVVSDGLKSSMLLMHGGNVWYVKCCAKELNYSVAHLQVLGFMISGGHRACICGRGCSVVTLDEFRITVAESLRGSHVLCHCHLHPDLVLVGGNLTCCPLTRRGAIWHPLWHYLHCPSLQECCFVLAVL